MIRIKSKNAGFRRCGVSHPAQWTEYPDDRFTPEQVKRFMAEPMLQVQFVLPASACSPTSNEAAEAPSLDDIADAPDVVVHDDEPEPVKRGRPRKTKEGNE